MYGSLSGLGNKNWGPKQELREGFFLEKQPGPIGPHQLAEALWSTQYEAALVSPDGKDRLS